MPQLTLQQAFTLALQHHQANRLTDAQLLYRQILAAQPNNPDALHLLGLTFLQSDNPAQAITLIRQSVALRPNNPEALSNLSNALRQTANFPDAITAARRSLALQPNSPEALGNLANALKDNHQLDDAISAYRQAIALNPNLPDAHHNLAKALLEKKLPDPAILSARQALALQPHNPEPLLTLGNALKEKGQIEDAIAAYRQALTLNPNFITAHSNLLFALHFSPNYTPAQILAEAQEFNRRHALPLASLQQPHTNTPDPARRLRIGYVSPDFRSHCQAFFTLPLLSNHDHTHFEIFCYSNVKTPDPITTQLQSHADHWLSTTHLTDQQLADQIRSDQIDILIDLTMHMANNRLLVFARKPAPIQISWLAYPGTTGLSAIDYRLTDPHLDPPVVSGQLSVVSNEHPLLHSDHWPLTTDHSALRLPETFWCYDPLLPNIQPPTLSTQHSGLSTPSPLPAESNHYITFGSLNNYCKVNPQQLSLWAQLLAAVKNSRLILLSPQGDHRQRALEIFAAQNISPDRIQWFAHASRADYLAAYHRIDIALDTLFPYNGHTTSLDALYMGVPVLTLPGPTIVSRAGLSQLQNLNLPDLIAHSPAHYLQLALDLATNLPRLAELRRTLRQKMQSSPLMNAPRFTHHLESTYRQTWLTWCNQQAQ